MSKLDEMIGHYCAKTDIGKVRLNNEDSAGVFVNSQGNVLLCVCDGMGGHNKGDYASKLALDLIKEEFYNKRKFGAKFLTRSWINKTLRKINLKIYNESEKSPSYHGMGTTFVMVLIVKDTMYIVNCGDSRAYEKTYDSLRQLTEDQSYVDYLYRAGKITKEEEKSHPQRHVIMNALGINSIPNIDLEIRPYLGNPILLCSDGLYGNISEKEFFSILDTDDRVEQKVDMLIHQANANGGPDNISVAYWEMEKQ